MAAPVGPKKVNRYTVEFKIQGVKLANHPEIQTQDVAHVLVAYHYEGTISPLLLVERFRPPGPHRSMTA